MHLPELAAVGTLGFARQIRDGVATIQTRNSSDPDTPPEGSKQPQRHKSTKRLILREGTPKHLISLAKGELLSPWMPQHVLE